MCIRDSIGDIQNSNFKGINIEDYKNHPQIKFLGRVSDKELIEYYSNAIGFIYPSLYEGFGIPILEAYACHCPIAISNTSCFPEIAGDAAIYFDPYSVKDIANTIEAIIYNPQKANELIQKGIKRLELYSWEKTVVETEETYKKAIQGYNF